jgi:hypothetical protein
VPDAPERKTPKQESPDTKRLRDDAKSPKDDAPDLQQGQTMHEEPKGDLGEVVKADYRVDPLAPDEIGHAEAQTEPVNLAHAKGLRGQALADAGVPTDKDRGGKKKGDPAKLREELEDLRQKVATGQAKPRDKIRITEAEQELEDAQKPD